MSSIGMFGGGGETSDCAAAVNWAATPLGPVSSWPPSLRTILGVIFHARHPMFLYWGPELVQFYNDGYLPSFGAGKHPAAMGQCGRECWAEIWPIIGPEIESALNDGASSWHEDQLVPIFRNGRTENVYWTYGYSPVPSETGIGGVLVVVTETTARVNALRRLGAVRLLGERSRAETPDLPALFAGMTMDLPIVLVFSVEDDELRMTSSHGLSAAELALLEPWFRAIPHARRTETLLEGAPLVRADLASQVFFTALVSPGLPVGSGFVAFGINPALALDLEYRAHLAQLAQGLADTMGQAAVRAAQEVARHQLAVADRMASVGTLAAGMAHEINNPLTFIKANLDMILEQIRSLAGGSSSSRFRELEEMVMDAHAGAERVGKIVRGLKTFSRTGEERRTRVELVPVLEMAIGMAANELRGRARLIKIYGDTPVLHADDARLGHVFINLLVNAAQALPEGRPENSEIRITTSTDAAGRAIVEIRDSGAGIPDAVLPRIFEPFFTTKGVGVGTGLGLSISHNIVAAMGGEITVTTEQGKGTAFRVALPPSPLTHPVSRDASFTEVTRRAEVMIVEDEPAIRIVLARALRDHSLTIVTSVAEAIAAIDTGKRFDVILSDLMLPEVSGMEFYDRVSQSHPEIAERMVFVTGGASTLFARTFLDRVPNERLEKPFTVHAVRELVQRFIGSPNGRDR